MPECGGSQRRHGRWRVGDAGVRSGGVGATGPATVGAHEVTRWSGASGGQHGDLDQWGASVGGELSATGVPSDTCHRTLPDAHRRPCRQPPSGLGADGCHVAQRAQSRSTV